MLIFMDMHILLQVNNNLCIKDINPALDASLECQITASAKQGGAFRVADTVIFCFRDFPFHMYIHANVLFIFYYC
jgi:hypothetical protein